jgi:predicted nuclease with TOPRIM domain
MSPSEQDLARRLEELRAELEKGRSELEVVDAHRTELRDTMLRIAGAIQVLEELLPEAEGAEATGADSAPGP